MWYVDDGLVVVCVASSLLSSPWLRSFFLPCEGHQCRFLTKLFADDDFSSSAQFFHAVLSSYVLMEPTCHLAILLIGLIMSLLLQVHQENADSCWSGHSSNRFELHAPHFYGVFFHIQERSFALSESFQI